jgi:transposase
MLTEEEFVEASALRGRGWSVSAIARHLGRDRKTIRAYLAGERQPGTRRPAVADRFARFEPYLRERLREDPHVWGTVLFDEVVALGFERSYVTFVRELRRRGLRPRCEACAGVRGRPTVEIEHPPGEEVQWDWLELPEAPWGGEAHLLVGTLPYSGRFRAVFCEAEDQAHLIEGIDGVLRRLGGTARSWRFDRMATVCDPGSGRLRSDFAAVARCYGVTVEICGATTAAVAVALVDPVEPGRRPCSRRRAASRQGEVGGQRKPLGGAANHPSSGRRHRSSFPPASAGRTFQPCPRVP